MTHCSFRIITLWLAWLAVALFPVIGLAEEPIPSELAHWRQWVLHGHESELCPGRFDAPAMTRCQWPSRLQLDINADGARFEQQWYIFAAGWVTLPGGAVSGSTIADGTIPRGDRLGGGNIWPDGVSLDGEPAVVVEKNLAPAIWVTAGEHRIQGCFFWQQTPDFLFLPPSLGLLTVTREGKSIALPEMVDQNILWLGRAQEAPARENLFHVKIFRRIVDTIPMQIITVFRLDVFGEGREIPLQGALLEGSIPMELESPLPARIDKDSRLIIQARPGQWQIEVKGRLTGPRYSLNAGGLPYGEEIWSFEPRHQLRMVEILNVAKVEPAQTEMPESWRQFSAFLMRSGDTMTLKEIRRGNPDPPPDQLTLQRTWWLDFNGDGFTMHDAISGSLSRQWHLAMNSPGQLGRVAVNGQNQMITALGKEKKAGVELRTGRLALEADSRMKKGDGPIQVVGWDHDFEAVSGWLNLPPGWRLMATAGIDKVSNTWLQAWSLLDLFLVLIIALAVIKLRNWKWGLVALILMALMFQEPGAPRLVWLHLLAVTALLPLLPPGWVRRMVLLWGMGALVTLMIQAVPFAVNQIQWGIYPQLAPHGTGPDVTATDTAMGPASTNRQEALATIQAEGEQTLRFSSREKSAKTPAKPVSLPAESSITKQNVLDQDPDALIPTGPGLPQWQWQTIALNWSGPITRSQTMRLYLLPPGINIGLAFLRVGLLIWLTAGLIQWRPWWRKIKTLLNYGALILLVGLTVSQFPATARAEETFTGFPPQRLLDELRERLLEKADCPGFCADISRMEISSPANRSRL